MNSNMTIVYLENIWCLLLEEGDRKYGIRIIQLLVLIIEFVPFLKAISFINYQLIDAVLNMAPSISTYFVVLRFLY